MNIDTKLGPFMKSNDNVTKIMRRVLISLIPIILFAFYKNGILLYKNGYTNIFGMFYPLIFILLGGMSSLISEEVFLIVFKKLRRNDLLESIKSGYGFLPGLFLSLVLPINTPLAILFIGGVFASIIGKMIYGGFGHNIFNPALVGAIFVMACYGALIGSKGGYLNSYEIDTISSATPLTNVSLTKNITYDTIVKPYGSLLDFFIGFIPGSLGEVSSALIILAFIYLTLTKTIKWRIPISYILSFTVMLFIYNIITGMGLWYILFELLTGGLLFGAVFMATDPVTSPVTNKGQILYGICLGIMTFILRYLTSYPEGVMTSILFMNILVLFFDKIGSRIEFNNLYNLSFIVVLIILLSSSIYIGIINIKDNSISNGFKILNKEVIDNKIIYTVSQKGFGGNIKAKITFDSKSIIEIDILKHYESEDRYSWVSNAKYIDKLIKHQDKLNEVDTVSGATITSQALKDMVSNTINAYINNNDVISSNDEIELISGKDNLDAKVYVLRLDSFGGKLDIQMVLKEGKIRSAIPLTYNDTCIKEANKSVYYNCPEYLEDDYINRLIVNQRNLDEVNTVSGATISSSALKKAFKYTKEELIK